MKSQNRRDSLDDFKEDSIFVRPRAVISKSQQLTKKGSTSSTTDVPKKPRRNCGICSIPLSESKYLDHFVACLKSRSSKLAAAAKAAKEG